MNSVINNLLTPDILFNLQKRNVQIFLPGFPKNIPKKRNKQDFFLVSILIENLITVGTC